MEILLDESRGIYIPRDFARCYDTAQWGISAEEAEILLAGPDHPDYWEVWDDVLCNAEYVDEEGAIWHLDMDGDLIAVRETNF